MFRSIVRLIAAAALTLGLVAATSTSANATLLEQGCTLITCPPEPSCTLITCPPPESCTTLTCPSLIEKAGKKKDVVKVKHVRGKGRARR